MTDIEPAKFLEGTFEKSNHWFEKRSRFIAAESDGCACGMSSSENANNSEVLGWIVFWV